MNVHTHTFNGVKYELYLEQFRGLAEDGKPDMPCIFLSRGLPYGEGKIKDCGAQMALKILLHECLHAEDWSKSEEDVDRTANEIGSLLWRLGYRRVRPKTKKGANK